MKKMNENAFTLIELLAVIVILAIIAVIATPLTINVINSSREKSFINSTYGLIDGARLLSAEQVFDDGSNEVVVNFTDSTADNTEFKVSGDMPNSGTIHLNSDGKVELKVWSEELGKCAEKGADEAEVKLTETAKEDCKIEVSTSVGKTFTEVMEPLLATGEVMNNDPDHNLRYVGVDSNNYVWFNKDENGNPEKWRIIGVFDGQAKIIRDKYYNESIKWDDTSDDSMTNNWEMSLLKILLNDGEISYLSSIKYNDNTSYEYIDLNHEWNIGGYDDSFETTGTRSVFYEAERGENKSSAMTSHLWNGAIGLIYPSDYGYSTSGDTKICDDLIYYWNLTTGKNRKAECTEKSWLYDSNVNNLNDLWTMTPSISKDSQVFDLRYTGRINNNYVNSIGAVKPVLFLKSNVKIIDGKGTFDQPYILGMEE